MRIAVISDIHANLPAFEVVLDDLPHVDQIVCAGDIVGYNPWPSACVDIMRDLSIPSVSGNHDRAVTTGTGFHFNALAQAGVEYAQNQLDEDALTWLDSLPTTKTLFDGRVKIVHGHPEDPDRYTYPHEFSGDLLGSEELLVMGHTHIPYGEAFTDGIVLNPGSVGQPRDGDARAAYAIVDLDDSKFEIRRVSYDIDRVREAIASAGLPVSLGERLSTGT